MAEFGFKLSTLASKDKLNKAIKYLSKVEDKEESKNIILAVELLIESINDDPKNYNSYMCLAELMRQMNLYEDAEKILLQMLSIFPADFKTKLLLQEIQNNNLKKKSKMDQKIHKNVVNRFNFNLGDK